MDTLERCFDSYLARHRKISDIAPFSLAYIRLLFAFKDDLPQEKLSVLLERQKQLRGQKFKSDGFDELRNSSRIDMDQAIRNNADFTREARLARMLFCAFLDSEESDFFYMTEPIFEFARNMGMSSDEVRKILESEFVGFSGLESS
ncbi:MAG: hypothetical protein V4673_10320 [Pseudomonadota bacterium]